MNKRLFQIFPVIFLVAPLLLAQEVDFSTNSPAPLSDSLKNVQAAENSNNLGAATAPTNAVSSAASSEATQPSETSSASPIQDTNIATNETVPTPEEPSSSIVPTDPSMVPPAESTPTTNDLKESLPSDPNVAPSFQQNEEVAPISSTESIEKKKEEIKIRYYEVRTQVEKDNSVAALRLKADKAVTDEEKRQTLHSYYELLFQKMKKIDPSISERCDLMKAAYLRHLEQICVQPTVPLNLAPTLESKESPTPQPDVPHGNKKGSKKKTPPSAAS